MATVVLLGVAALLSATAAPKHTSPAATAASHIVARRTRPPDQITAPYPTGRRGRHFLVDATSAGQRRAVVSRESPALRPKLAKTESAPRPAYVTIALSPVVSNSLSAWRPSRGSSSAREPVERIQRRPLGAIHDVAGLMVAGRNASGMASELGSMKVTEQIDAMRALGTDPTKKLVTPRVMATVVMLFFLSILSDFLGVIGGFVISYLVLGLDAQQYWHSAYDKLSYDDIEMGLIKPALFGYVIATVGCYYGLSAKGGTQGVGRATTQAVVAASVLILAVDLFVTRFLMLVT